MALRLIILALGVGFICGFYVTYIYLISYGFFHPVDIYDERYADDPDFEVGTHSLLENFHRGEDQVAMQIAKRVRVLCWVMTAPKNHLKKARHVKATWGKRCNILLFMSSEKDAALPAIKLSVREGYKYLWAKTKEAFKYVYEHHLNDSEWFMKADDDTYVIVENLRYMLSSHQASEPIYFGSRFSSKHFVRQGYMNGGAGYVLSRQALKLFYEKGLNNLKMCGENHRAEDVEMGKCMENLGVKAGDSRDYLKRGTFFPYSPKHHLIPGDLDSEIWYGKYSYHSTKEGIGCCSDFAITFHYVPPNHMYVMDFLIYHVRPYGISHQIDQKITKGLKNNTQFHNRKISSVKSIE